MSRRREGRPLFVFNVTMQNHGGYDQTYTNFSPGISVDGVNSISVSQYFSLIKLSDQALEQLIDYFSGVDEKTVIVFFGDHQPSDTVAAPILAMNGMQWNALDEEQQSCATRCRMSSGRITILMRNRMRTPAQIIWEQRC